MVARFTFSEINKKQISSEELLSDKSYLIWVYLVCAYFSDFLASEFGINMITCNHDIHVFLYFFFICRP